MQTECGIVPRMSCRHQISPVADPRGSLKVRQDISRRADSFQPGVVGANPTKFCILWSNSNCLNQPARRRKCRSIHWTKAVVHFLQGLEGRSQTKAYDGDPERTQPTSLPGLQARQGGFIYGGWPLNCWPVRHETELPDLSQVIPPPLSHSSSDPKSRPPRSHPESHGVINPAAHASKPGSFSP